MDDLKITLPDIVFSDSLWILGSERDVKLMEFKNGHTASDIVLCVPDQRIVFAGDLLFVQRHPWMSDGDPASAKDCISSSAAIRNPSSASSELTAWLESFGSARMTVCSSHCSNSLSS